MSHWGSGKTVDHWGGGLNPAPPSSKTDAQNLCKFSWKFSVIDFGRLVVRAVILFRMSILLIAFACVRQIN